MVQLDPAYFVIGKQETDKWRTVNAYTCNDKHPPLTVLHGEHTPETEPVYHSTVDKHGHLVVHLQRQEFQTTPPLWYVLHENPNGLPPNLSLLAFATPEFPQGTIITPQEAQQHGIQPTQQIAAIQWGYKNPKLHQIAVSPQWRRRRIALALIGTADVVNMSGNYSGDTVIYGGDVTTSGGETLRQAWAKSPRVTPRQGEIH